MQYSILMWIKMIILNKCWFVSSSRQNSEHNTTYQFWHSCQSRKICNIFVPWLTPDEQCWIPEIVASSTSFNTMLLCLHTHSMYVQNSRFVRILDEELSVCFYWPIVIRFLTQFEVVMYVPSFTHFWAKQKVIDYIALWPRAVIFTNKVFALQQEYMHLQRVTWKSAMQCNASSSILHPQ